MSIKKRFHEPIKIVHGKPYHNKSKLEMAKATLQRASISEIRAKSISNLDRWEASGSWVSANDEWRKLMADGGDEEVISAMTGEDENSVRLRQSAPYTGILDEPTRQAIRTRAFTKRLFMDTEFTDFIDCDLISIGIVSEDGHEFYAERNDFDRDTCSDFVRVAVLPQLGKDPAQEGNAEEIRHALLKWLAQFNLVEICVDYSTDWELFLDLCQGRPDGVSCRLVTSELSPTKIEQYWRENGRQDHHALHDARAIRFAFSENLSDE